MAARSARNFVLLAGTAAGAWSHTPETLTGPERAVAAQVNVPFEHRLRNGGAVVTLSPAPNGLQVANGVITGTPKAAMVMHAVADRPEAVGAVSDTTWIVVFASAFEPPALPRVPHRYRGASENVPAHLSAIAVRGVRSSSEAIELEANPTSDAGASLGRVLFYDRRLSFNDAVSCASCHLQAAGFADTARLSRGFDGRLTRRHSMALANVRFSSGSGFFWDQRAKTLEQLVLMPIQDSIEMGMSLPNLQRKLNLIPYYPALFKAAFGSPEITIDRTANALAQFLRTLVSADSPFDRAFEAGNFAPNLSRLTALQRDGFEVFRSTRCSFCHFSSTQIVTGAMNTGLDAEPTDSGAGRGTFRSPSLRNVAVRAPYMHDGRFKSLEEVVDFYASGVKNNPNLDARLRDRGTQTPRKLSLTSEQRSSLLAFLHALTDSTFLSAPEFSDPFRHLRDR